MFLAKTKLERTALEVINHSNLIFFMEIKPYMEVRLTVKRKKKTEKKCGKNLVCKGVLKIFGYNYLYTS